MEIGWVLWGRGSTGIQGDSVKYCDSLWALAVVQVRQVSNVALVVRRIQVHPIPAGLKLKIGPQSLWTLDTWEPAGGVRGTNVGTTAEPLHSFFFECRLSGPVTPLIFTGSAPKVSHFMR